MKWHDSYKQMLFLSYINFFFLFYFLNCELNGLNWIVCCVNLSNKRIMLGLRGFDIIIEIG